MIIRRGLKRYSRRGLRRAKYLKRIVNGKCQSCSGKIAWKRSKTRCHFCLEMQRIYDKVRRDRKYCQKYWSHPCATNRFFDPSESSTRSLSEGI